MLGMMSLVLTTLLQASGVAACSMSSGYEPFEISKDAQPLDAPEDALGAPKAEVVSVTRGVGGVPGSCDASGILVLSVKPRSGDYKADDLGYEFKVLGNGAGKQAFPAGAVAIPKSNGRGELVLGWADDAPGQQRPLQLQVEVREITRGYLRGPATVVYIDTRPAEVIKAEARAREEAEKAQRKLAKEQGD